METVQTMKTVQKSWTTGKPWKPQTNHGNHGKPWKPQRNHGNHGNHGNRKEIMKTMETADKSWKPWKPWKPQRNHGNHGNCKLYSISSWQNHQLVSPHRLMCHATKGPAVSCWYFTPLSVYIGSGAFSGG